MQSARNLFGVVALGNELEDLPLSRGQVHKDASVSRPLAAHMVLHNICGNWSTQVGLSSGNASHGTDKLRLGTRLEHVT